MAKRFGPGANSNKSKGGNYGLASARRSGAFQPGADSAVAAASLRSVLASMSDEELLRYKVAFQNADQDEDGYLDVTQAMKALHSCGVAVSGNAMLDSLDDLEVAQEGDRRSSEWELEQGRRRRRRRRNSLAELENEVFRESGREHREQEDSAEPLEDSKQYVMHPLATRGRRKGKGGGGNHKSELEKLNQQSSLRSPSIDISTFLNLLNRRPPESPRGPVARRSNNNPAPGHVPVLGRHSSRALASPSHQPQASSSSPSPPAETWERHSYQQQSSGQARPLLSLAGLAGGGVQGTSSPRLFPSLRLRDYTSESGLRLHPQVGLGLHPSDRDAGSHPHGSSSSRKSGGAGAGGMLDDDDDDDFNPEADLLAAFHTFDPSQSGTMSVPHLAAILTHMGEKWSPEEAQEMVDEVDHRGEGRINYRQLVHKLMARE